MRIAFVNLPHPIPVIRRYMCSYNSPIFLYPPQELMYAATAVRDWGGDDVRVIDCIARRMDRDHLAEELQRFDPQMIVAILGFEILEDDLRHLLALRQQFPQVKFAAMGHYATVFSREIMEHAQLDYIFQGEPEYTCHELVTALKVGRSPQGILGLVYRGSDGAVTLNPERPRLKPVDELPHPDYGLVNIDHYSEIFFPKPLATLQTARGCPYACNFCVRSYGRQLTYRSPANILDEIRKLVDRFGVRSLRFMDDTFTAVPQRTLDICRGIEEQFPGMVWSCLSRVDTIDDERAAAMAAAGCKRVYVGIESGSQRILKLYGKDYGVERIAPTFEMIKRHGLEIGCFFMVGHPEETPEDFEQTRRLIRSLEIDYATVAQTTPYPGTSLFDQYRDQVDFSLFPYHNEWKSPDRRQELLNWERRFFREMYFRPTYMARHAWRFLRNPGETLRCGKAILPFMMGNGLEAARNEVL